MSVAFLDIFLTVSVIAKAVFGELARAGTKTHVAAVSCQFFLILHDVYHWVCCLRVELSAVGIFKLGHVARIFNDRNLHAEA